MREFPAPATGEEWDKRRKDPRPKTTPAFEAERQRLQDELSDQLQAVFLAASAGMEAKTGRLFVTVGLAAADLVRHMTADKTPGEP